MNSLTQKKLRKKQKRQGFTLIEVIIVVIILGLIAALIVPRMFKKVEKSKRQLTKTQIVMIEGSIKFFKMDTGRYPTTQEGLKVLLENPGNVPNWDGPYLEKGIPKDPWGRDYVYTYPGKNYTFELISLGADGQPGGEDENKDVTNYEVGPE